MSQIYLHHYPESPFSEKIRAILGFLGLEWNSVTISMIMPRPLLMPLSGGYRRTPVLQIGANVYCDTKIIARALADHAGDAQLFAGGFAAHRIADWADTHLFRVCVGLLFRPEALGPMMAKGGFGNVDMGAFMKDRAELVGGQPLATFSAPAAEGYVLHYLSELETSVASTSFLLGNRPTIADFSVYHCLWFLRNSPYNAPLVESRRNVMGWMERMAAFGHGKRVDSSAEAALAAARASEPVAPKAVVLELKAELGQTVKVAPIDYGRVPVSGELVCADAEQVALLRSSEETGRVITHFPRAGFELVA
jgi:glutathione S-transferase